MTRRHKKKRTHVPMSSDEYDKIPKSFIIKSGQKVGSSVSQLVKDMRRVMEPNTATNLKERKGNKLKDFVHIAAQVSVTHLMIFSRSSTQLHLRVGRIPRGPTTTFRVHSYTLAKDVLSLQNKPKSPGSEFKTAPLVVLNNFNDQEKHYKLVATMLQNLFPSIKLQTIKLADARRVILFHLNKDTNRIEFRHYSINVKLTGVSKSVKALIQANIPDLNQYEDVNQFILQNSMGTESDYEDGGESTVTLGDKYIGKGNEKSQERAIRLVELGPRLELSLQSIQAGLCTGDMLYQAPKEEEEPSDQEQEVSPVQKKQRLDKEE